MRNPVVRPIVLMLCVMGATLVIPASDASASIIWGGGHHGQPPAPAPTGLVWGGGGNAQPPASAPTGLIWGGGKGQPHPPAPTGLIWGGGRFQLLLTKLGLIRE